MRISVSISYRESMRPISAISIKAKVKRVFSKKTVPVERAKISCSGIRCCLNPGTCLKIKQPKTNIGILWSMVQRLRRFHIWSRYPRKRRRAEKRTRLYLALERYYRRENGERHLPLNRTCASSLEVGHGCSPNCIRNRTGLRGRV